MNIDHWRNPELAASETPKAQEGTWTLTAPDGRTFTAPSPIKCCAAESNQRIPPAVALARIARGLDEDAAQEIAVIDAPQDAAAPCPVCRGVGSYGEPPLRCDFCQNRRTAAHAKKLDIYSPFNALACGHPASLMLKSAETGADLYCELCDARSGRHDAEQREAELTGELAEANETIKNLVRALGEEVNGPTFMGEPVVLKAPGSVPLAPVAPDALWQQICDVVKAWHGEEVFDLYRDHSPEMQRIKAALFAHPLEAPADSNSNDGHLTALRGKGLPPPLQGTKRADDEIRPEDWRNR